MGDLHLTFLPRLFLGSLVLLAGCDSQGPGKHIDFISDATFEQPGNENEQVVHVTFHRGARLAKHAQRFQIILEVEARPPIEHVSLGELVPENDRDAFENTNFNEHSVVGEVSLAPCPDGSDGEACSNVFSCVVTSSSPAQGKISLSLLGSLPLAHGDADADWSNAPPFSAKLQLAP